MKSTGISALGPVEGLVFMHRSQESAPVEVRIPASEERREEPAAERLEPGMVEASAASWTKKITTGEL